MILSRMLSLVFVPFWLAAPCYSQNSQPAPLPGSTSYTAAPLPGSMPVPGNFNSTGSNAGPYRRLPISAQAAAARLEELRNLMPNSRPKEFQDAVGDYLEWLSDMADSHWRIHQSFVKVDSLKPQAEQEKQTTLRLGQLKRQAMLLKAEFLIRENRQPEALAPLVEIVVAEPKTELGRSAYSLLKEIGFSEAVAVPTASVLSAEEEQAHIVLEEASSPSSVASPASVSVPKSKTVTAKPQGKTAANR